VIPSRHITLPIIPTGRRIFAHRQVRERAQEAGLMRLVAHVDRAIAHDRECLQLQMKLRAKPSARFSPEAGRLDGLLDRAVTGLDNYLDSHVRILGEDSDEGRAAAELRIALFPDSVGALTRLAYVQEDEAVAALLERLRQPDLAPLAAKIPNLDHMLDSIRNLHRQYHEVLRKEHAGPTREDVRASQMEGQELICCTVGMIVGHYAETGDSALCNRLMVPIEQQIADVRAARQRRRPPRDVDPDTGEEIGPAELEVTD
jgi:hypothetical protein